MLFERKLGAGGAGQTSLYRFGGHRVVAKQSFSALMSEVSALLAVNPNPNTVNPNPNPRGKSSRRSPTR